MNDADLAWNLFVELRKEIVETQKIRSQVIGFKITFSSTAIGVIIAGSGKWPLQLLAAVPRREPTRAMHARAKTAPRDRQRSAAIS